MAQETSVEAAISQLMNAVKSVDMQLKVLAQEIKTIKSNERIMGQTIVALNNKVKELEKKLGELETGGIQVSGEEGAKVSVDMTPIEELRKELENLKKSIVSKSEIDQLKYTIDMINPLQYVTGNDVEDIVNKILRKKEEKKK